MTSTSTIWAYPGARLLLPIEASREDWLAARRNGIGGSEVAALMDAVPPAYNQTPYTLWLEKNGKAKPKEVSLPMQMGLALEPLIAKLFAEATGLATRRAGLLQSKKYPHLFSTVDRLTSDGGGAEFKYSGDWRVTERLQGLTLGEAQPHWLWQCLTYLAVTGRSHWWLVALVPQLDEVYIERIDAAEYAEVIAAIGPIVEAWWARHMVGGEAPAEGAPREYDPLVPKSVAKAPDLDKAREIRREWLALGEQIKEMEDSLKARKAEADAIFDDPSVPKGTKAIVDDEGDVLFTRVVNKGRETIDAKGLLADSPELYEKHLKTGDPFGYVLVAKPKGPRK